MSSANKVAKSSKARNKTTEFEEKEVIYAMSGDSFSGIKFTHGDFMTTVLRDEIITCVSGADYHWTHEEFDDFRKSVMGAMLLLKTQRS